MRNYKESDIQVGDVLVYDGVERYEIIGWGNGQNRIRNLVNLNESWGSTGTILKCLNGLGYTLLKTKSNNFNSLYDKLNNH